jgi:hypothetical protein
MITYEIKIPITTDIREIFFNRNTNKLSYKNDLGIIFPLDPVATSTPTLQEVLTAGNALPTSVNFQGTNAGLNNTGGQVVGLGASAGSTYMYHNQATNSIGAVRL